VQNFLDNELIATDFLSVIYITLQCNLQIFSHLLAAKVLFAAFYPW